MEIDRRVIIDKIRKFNRFYTNITGLLDRHFLDTPYSLTEARVLYEISHTRRCTAKKIRNNIDIDEGYLSRVIDRFMQRGLIKRSPLAKDRRLHLIELTNKGKGEFSELNANSNKAISKLIENLSEEESEELVGMMDRIRRILLLG